MARFPMTPVVDIGNRAIDIDDDGFHG